MNKSSGFKRWTLIALLAAGTLSWAQAEYIPEVIQGPGQRNALKHRPVNQAANGQPRRVDKASRLVGMEVTNPKGRILGKIQEVVINFKTGQVAYCVMGAEGLFNNKKLFALPLNAFEPSRNGNHLILHASRKNLTQAKGFNRHHWPSVNSNHPWGAHPFWSQSAASSGGTNHPPAKAGQPKDTHNAP